MKLPLSVLILARDEEVNLPDCLHSVSGWAGQVVVVLDPRTRDCTAEIAEQFGAEVVEHPFAGFPHQRNWALENVAWRHPWILILDADERVSPQLRRDVQSVLDDRAPKDAYAVRFRFIFYGKWLRRCWYGTWIVRLLRLGKARFEIRDVHEHMIVDGETGYLQGDLIHSDFKDMHSWIEKHNAYATVEAWEAHHRDGSHLRGHLRGTRVERRRFLKERVWTHLPFRPFWLFLYLYVFRLGFLEGGLGLRFCLMHAVFQEFIEAKAWEAERLSGGAIPNYYRQLIQSDLREHPEESELYGS